MDGDALVGAPGAPGDLVAAPGELAPAGLEQGQTLGCREVVAERDAGLEGPVVGHVGVDEQLVETLVALVGDAVVEHSRQVRMIQLRHHPGNAELYAALVHSLRYCGLLDASGRFVAPEATGAWRLLEGRGEVAAFGQHGVVEEAVRVGLITEVAFAVADEVMGFVAREARAVFSETVVPRDFDIIDVRFPERGGPRLVKGGALGKGEEAEALGSDGAVDGGGRPRRGGGDPDDPALGRDRVGARAGRRAASDPAR